MKFLEFILNIDDIDVTYYNQTLLSSSLLI